MGKTPVLKIDGVRYTARRLKFGAYKQILLLTDALDELNELELQEDIVEALRLTFDLTREQADRIDVEDLVPVFRAVAVWARGRFTAKVQQIPNAESPDATQGQD